MSRSALTRIAIPLAGCRLPSLTPPHILTEPSAIGIGHLPRSQSHRKNIQPQTRRHTCDVGIPLPASPAPYISPATPIEYLSVCTCKIDPCCIEYGCWNPGGSGARQKRFQVSVHEMRNQACRAILKMVPRQTWCRAWNCLHNQLIIE